MLDVPDSSSQGDSSMVTVGAGMIAANKRMAADNDSTDATVDDEDDDGKNCVSLFGLCRLWYRSYTVSIIEEAQFLPRNIEI